MAIHEDLLVSGSWDKTLRVWNIKSGICKKVLNLHSEGKCMYAHVCIRVYMYICMCVYLHYACGGA